VGNPKKSDFWEYIAIDGVIILKLTLKSRMTAHRMDLSGLGYEQVWVFVNTVMNPRGIQISVNFLRLRGHTSC